MAAEASRRRSTRSITVPAAAETPLLIGSDQTRYGVVMALAGEVQLLGFTDERHATLVNIVTHLSRGHEHEDPVRFVQALTGRLRWMTWALPVAPGSVVQAEDDDDDDDGGDVTVVGEGVPAP